MSVAVDVSLPCDDIIEFKETLKLLRKVDDNIIYELNNSVPTQSFKDSVSTQGECMRLFSMISDAHVSRESAIRHCIKKVSNNVQELSLIGDKNPDDQNNFSLLRGEQSSLRMMNAELFVEEVVRDRTVKVFKERCKAYKIPNDYSKKFSD
eukprot:Sdes_comp20856_c0_seq3m17676